jgi:protein TonB
MLLLLLQAAASSAGQPPAKPHAIFSRDDYPLEAVAHHWEGTAVAELTIDTQGRPTGCRIVESTGHKVLDDATCGLILRRAMFTPAMDKSGKPIGSTLRSPPVTWRLNP